MNEHAEYWAESLAEWRAEAERCASELQNAVSEADAIYLRTELRALEAGIERCRAALAVESPGPHEAPHRAVAMVRRFSDRPSLVKVSVSQDGTGWTVWCGAGGGLWRTTAGAWPTRKAATAHARLIRAALNLKEVAP